jgi:hypothetical protein
MSIEKKIKRLDGYIYQDKPSIKNYIFICGLHRSGTTLLEELISSFFDVSCLRMTALKNEGQFAQEVYPPASVFGGPGKFAFNPYEQIQLNKLKNYSEYQTRIMSDWGKYVVGNSHTLLEKSPPNLTKIWWLRLVFPESKFIIITRDPVVTSLATQKWSKTSLELLLEHWNVAYSKAYLDSNEKDTIFIKYEDLCENLEIVLNQIGKFTFLTQKNSIINKDIENSNEKYLSSLSKIPDRNGIWEKFGYKLCGT